MRTKFSIVMDLVSLNSNCNLRYLWDLARLCVWLELVAPSLICIFNVVWPLNDRDIPRTLEVITVDLMWSIFLDWALAFEGWGPTTRALVPWRHGYGHPRCHHCMGWLALPTFEWYMVKYVVNMEHQKHRCNNEIGVCAQNLDTTLGLVR